MNPYSLGPLFTFALLNISLSLSGKRNQMYPDYLSLILLFLFISLFDSPQPRSLRFPSGASVMKWGLAFLAALLRLISGILLFLYFLSLIILGLGLVNLGNAASRVCKYILNIFLDWVVADGITPFIPTVSFPLMNSHVKNVRVRKELQRNSQISKV